jgi:O-antigen/teichoic acid export membrane protein
MMVVVGGAITLALLVASPLVRTGLSIASLAAVVLTVLVTVPSFLAPVMVGAAQGCQRFVLVAVAFAGPPLVRLVLAAGALAAGGGVVGAMAASLAASAVAVAIPLVALRRSLQPVAGWRPRLAGDDARALLPVLVGMLAITCLTIDDLVAAKVAFAPHEAGLYGAASLVGRVILYLPVAIVTVLLPIVAARVSAGRTTADLFRRSLVATGAFCLLCTAVYALLPHLIVRIAFGSKYDGSSSLLWMFGISNSLVNVVLVYRLGHGETRTAWLLMAGVFLQAALFAGFHDSPRELLTASIATAATLLAATVVIGHPAEGTDSASGLAYAAAPGSTARTGQTSPPAFPQPK